MTVAVSALMVVFASVMACVILGYFERNLHQNISAQQLSIITYIANEVDNTLLTAQRLLVANADSFPLGALESPDQATLKAMMKTVGFGHVDVHNLTGGVVALHVGIKC